MKLAEFTVKNYKSLREVKAGFGNYTALIGENGSGKTSILEALYLFFKDFSIVGGSPSPILQQNTSWHNKKLALEFIAEIVLDEGECKDVFPEKVLDKIIEKYGDKYKELTICRRIPKSGAPWETVYINVAKVPLVKDNAIVSPEELTKSVSKVAPKRPSGKVKAFLFDPNANQSNLIGSRLIVLNDTAYHMDDYTDSLVREAKIPFEQLPGEDYKVWAVNKGFSLVENPPAKGDVDVLLTEETPLVTNEILQNAQNKIVEKIKGKLKLIPATRNERVEPGERSSFLSGPAVINPLRSLHGTDDEAWHEIRTAIERLIGQELDSVPQLSTWENGLHLDVSLIGGGQQEIISLVYQIYKATEPIIAIEEPETHLHHNLSRKLFEVLKEAANTKQLIVATHSEYFAEISGVNKNWFLEKKGKEAKPREIKAPKELLKVFGSLGAEPSDRGYPNKVLFVAGETEEDVLPVWAKILNVNIEKVRIEPLEGERDRRKIEIINNYIKDAQTIVFLMVDGHASDKVKQAVDEEHRLILKGTIEDCYPVEILLPVLNELYDLNLTNEDIDRQKSRVDEIERILKERKSVSNAKGRKLLKKAIGRGVAKQMSKDNIPEEIRDFIIKVAK